MWIKVYWYTFLWREQFKSLNLIYSDSCNSLTKSVLVSQQSTLVFAKDSHFVLFEFINLFTKLFITFLLYDTHLPWLYPTNSPQVVSHYHKLAIVIRHKLTQKNKVAWVQLHRDPKLSSYHGSFRELHRPSMGLLEIFRVTLTTWGHLVSFLWVTYTLHVCPTASQN